MIYKLLDDEVVCYFTQNFSMYTKFWTDFQMMATLTHASEK